MQLSCIVGCVLSSVSGVLLKPKVRMSFPASPTSEILTPPPPELYGVAIENLWTVPLSALPEGTFLVVRVFCYFELLNPNTSHLLTCSFNLLHSNMQTFTRRKINI